MLTNAQTNYNSNKQNSHEGQQIDNNNFNKITSFNIVEKQNKLPEFSLKLELISISNYTFNIKYTYQTQYRQILSQ